MFILGIYRNIWFLPDDICKQHKVYYKNNANNRMYEILADCSKKDNVFLCKQIILRKRKIVKKKYIES